MRSLSLVALLALALSGCATVQSPVTGFAFTSTQAPITATGEPRGSKKGEASSMSIFGLIAVGESSINAAAERAGISKISHVDTESFSLLGIYASYKVVVYGE